MNGRMTGDGTPLAPYGLTAAMEPADERPDDDQGAAAADDRVAAAMGR